MRVARRLAKMGKKKRERGERINSSQNPGTIASVQG